METEELSYHIKELGSANFGELTESKIAEMIENSIEYDLIAHYEIWPPIFPTRPPLHSKDYAAPRQRFNDEDVAFYYPYLNVPKRCVVFERFIAMNDRKVGKSKK